jgi:hypothetical protein
MIGSNAMQNKLCWLAIGGLSFWLPLDVVATALHQNVDLWILNVVPLAGLALLGVVSWIAAKRLPKWGWVLAGIYILGPVSMLAPLFCLFPPLTLWMAGLNGTIFSVLIATLILPFLAYRERSVRDPEPAKSPF